MHVETLLRHVHPIKGFSYETMRLSGERGSEQLCCPIRPHCRNRPICSACGTAGPTYDRLPARTFQMVPLWGIPVLLASGLPSPFSSPPTLAGSFDGFIGTTPLSDFPGAFVSGVRPSAFPDRSAAMGAAETPGTSRFSCRRCPCMLSVCDCAESFEALPVSASPVMPSASLHGVGTREYWISQFNGWPALSPVNASRPTLRPSAHDSGSG
jgi:hypothetical protein